MWLPTGNKVVGASFFFFFKEYGEIKLWRAEEKKHTEEKIKKCQ